MTATQCISPRQTIIVPPQTVFPASKALVIEDHPGLAGLFEQVFTRNGIDTEVLSHGDEALMRLRNRDTDYGLVCSDVDLPGASGWSVLEWSQTFRPDLPVMLVSGANNGRFVRDAHRRGAVAAFCKPFSIARIQQTVAAFFPYV